MLKSSTSKTKKQRKTVKTKRKTVKTKRRTVKAKRRTVGTFWGSSSKDPKRKFGSFDDLDSEDYDTQLMKVLFTQHREQILAEIGKQHFWLATLVTLILPLLAFALLITCAFIASVK